MLGAEDRVEVAFVSHRANRTGAPIVLLELVRAAVASDLRCGILLLEDGPLRGDFEALAPTQVADWEFFEGPAWVRIACRLGLRRWATAIHRRSVARALGWLVGARVVHLNSVECVRLLRVLPSTPPLLVTHVHEMRNGIDLAVANDWDLLATATHRFIAASGAVSQELERRGIDATSIDTCHEFISLGRFGSKPPLACERGQPPVAIAIGSVSTRKGADLFVQAVLQLRVQRPDLTVRFRWVGSPSHDPDAARWMRHDIAVADLEDVIEMVGEVEDATAMLAEADVFVLPSREDPFPLACLEAAAAGVPIVGFDCGGMKELLDGAALFVPVPRSDLLAAAIAELLDNPALGRRLAQEARRRVAEVDAQLGAQRVLSVLRRHLP